MTDLEIFSRPTARVARTLFPALLIVACIRAAEPPAAPVAQQIAPPPPEPSTIVIPIRTSIAPLAPQIESRVPARFADTARERGIDIRYQVVRDPIRMRMIGSGVHSSTTFRYAMQACRGRFPCISCGYGEPPREAQITLHTALEWDAAWRLRSATRLLPVDYARPCQVTWLDIDITRRFVAPVVEQQLGAAAKIIDRNVPALTNIRPQAAQVWASLQTPIELAPRTWLVLEPDDVALTPISGAGSTIASTLALRAMTRVAVGEPPAVSRKPLPPLRTIAAAPGGGIRVPLDLEIPYDEASRIATRELAGRTYRVGDTPLAIESIRLAPGGHGRLRVEAMVDYRGGTFRTYRGPVLLEGTPRFDPASSTIVLPDLDYAIDPDRGGFLTRIAERAAHEAIRDRLRETARLPLAGRIAEVREEVTRALNRQLAPGVHLRGRADAVDVRSVNALSNAISVRVVVTGAAHVEISEQAMR